MHFGWAVIQNGNNALRLHARVQQKQCPVHALLLLSFSIIHVHINLFITIVRPDCVLAFGLHFGPCAPAEFPDTEKIVLEMHRCWPTVFIKRERHAHTATQPGHTDTVHVRIAEEIGQSVNKDNGNNNTTARLRDMYDADG